MRIKEYVMKKKDQRMIEEAKREGRVFKVSLENKSKTERKRLMRMFNNALKYYGFYFDVGEN